MNYINLNNEYEKFWHGFISNYYNKTTGEIIDEYEMQNILGQDNFFYTKEDFIQLPTIEENLHMKFLEDFNVKSLLNKARNFKEEEFGRQFHILIEDNRLSEHYNNFLQKYLINVAKKWCEENNIKYTLKEENHYKR